MHLISSLCWEFQYHTQTADITTQAGHGREDINVHKDVLRIQDNTLKHDATKQK